MKGLPATLALLLLVLSWPAAGLAAGGGPPPGPLASALQESAGIVYQEGLLLLRAAGGREPEARGLREDARRLLAQAAEMTATAADLSVEAEQAARSVRRECAALSELAEVLRGRGGRHPEVARRLLAEAERLRRRVRELPVPWSPEPFEGLATGLSPI